MDHRRCCIWFSRDGGRAKKIHHTYLLINRWPLLIVWLVVAFKVQYILVEALALLLRVRSHVVLEFIKMSVKDMDFEGHPAAHGLTVWLPNGDFMLTLHWSSHNGFFLIQTPKTLYIEKLACANLASLGVLRKCLLAGQTHH